MFLLLIHDTNNIKHFIGHLLIVLFFFLMINQTLVPRHHLFLSIYQDRSCLNKNDNAYTIHI